MTKMTLEFCEMIRVRSTAYVGKNVTAPWSVFIEEAPALARFHLVLAGSTWVSLDGTSDGVFLKAGEMVIVPHGKAHFYFDEPGRGITMVGRIPSEKAPYFHQLDENSSSTNLFCGYFNFSDSTDPALRSNLPEMLVVRAGEGARAHKINLYVQLISAEVAKKSKPSQSILNRLTEILCIYAIQDWLEQAPLNGEPPDALINPRIRLVIDAIHSNPSKQWTVSSLARISGQSRTTFAAEFKSVTGQSPISYVRKWRIQVACKILEETSVSIDEVAYKTGYADTNAFSRAFRQQTGRPPGAYRRQ